MLDKMVPYLVILMIMHHTVLQLLECDFIRPIGGLNCIDLIVKRDANEALVVVMVIAGVSATTCLSILIQRQLPLAVTIIHVL